jgi:hypothetical protein
MERARARVDLGTAGDMSTFRKCSVVLDRLFNGTLDTDSFDLLVLRRVPLFGVKF